MKSTYSPENASLDNEEQWFEDHFDEFVPMPEIERQALIKAARNPPRVVSEKKQMVSIRLAPQDVQAIREQAEKRGLAYQTLISSLLHQYAVGDLVNIDDARKLMRRSQ